MIVPLRYPGYKIRWQTRQSQIVCHLAVIRAYLSLATSIVKKTHSSIVPFFGKGALAILANQVAHRFHIDGIASELQTAKIPGVLNGCKQRVVVIGDT